jgi:hypothetical protein
MKNLTPKQKKAILLKHYTIDEICEIMGYYDDSNADELPMEKLEELQLTNLKAFEDLMLDHAIINGNFEDVIKDDMRIAL